MYTLERPDFYDHQAERVWNPLRRWFHRERARRIRELVGRYIGEAGEIVDLGCGNCYWNRDGVYKVTGVDINGEALAYALQRGRLWAGVVGDVRDVPLEGGRYDGVVCSEVLEHIPDFWRVLGEARRILRDGGVLVVSVPHDTLLSLWRPLFTVQCLWEGWVKGDPYYRAWCGHVNAFSPRTVAMYMGASGFRVVECRSNGFTVFVVGVKA